MLFIGDGPSGFRVFYKGLDVMFEGFARAQKYFSALQLSIVGDWEIGVRQAVEHTSTVPPSNVCWLGHTPQIKDILARHSLYIHCARGDAWPNAVMEAMAAGVPALVSEWTGAREVVAKVDQKLVVPLDPDVIAERILWYFSLPVGERVLLGEKARETIRSQYTESQDI